MSTTRPTNYVIVQIQPDLTSLAHSPLGRMTKLPTTNVFHADEASFGRVNDQDLPYMFRSTRLAQLIRGLFLSLRAVTCITLTGCATELPPARIPNMESLPDGPVASLYWTQPQRIVGLRNFDVIFPSRTIDPGDQFLPLAQDAGDYSDLTYQVDDKIFSLEQYLDTYDTGGLLVVDGDKIRLEQYRLGHSQTSRWVSYSIAKSVTSLLIGAAIHDGYIGSVDEPITAYLPKLKGSAYDRASIRNVLQMSSGVAWNEDYSDADSDVAQAGSLNGVALFNYLRELPGVADPGTRFNYNTAETHLAGQLLRAAIGNNASSYLSARIWQPFMEHKGSWLLDSGVETGGCCLNATLRDYARIGLFALNDGVLPDGTRVLPEGWIAASTSPSAAYPGYGYLWWLGEDTFSAVGIFGQIIWIDPANEIVIVTQSAWPTPVGREMSQHRGALIQALAKRTIENRR